MELTLYHYVHCPFCVRVRMALGFFKLPYESIVLSYDDEKTPEKLTGKKMLPIMLFGRESMNESLDIIATLDQKDVLRVKATESSPAFADFNKLLDKLGKNVHSLAMPYWIYTPEFTESSRPYFQKKKEEKRGPFKLLVRNRKTFENELMNDLLTLETDVQSFYRSEDFTIYDIILASHLWGLYIVPEFQFPAGVHKYLQRVKDKCNFDYHSDFWN